MTRSILALTLLLALPVAAAAQDVTVYIRAAGDDAPFVDADLQARRDTAADLRQALRKTKGIVLVDDPARAVLTVEIVSRGLEATGSLERKGVYEIGPDIKATKEMTIRARLLAPQNYTTELVAQRDRSQYFESGRWRDLATRLARQLDRWVKTNRATLSAAR